MRGGNDDGAARQQPQPSTPALDTANYATQPRRTSTLAAVARAVIVTARTGATRALLTYRCPGCGAHHAATTRELVPVLLRRTACGAGRIELHTNTMQVAA